eukprot:3940612-Rhodomonas_salina.1
MANATAALFRHDAIEHAHFGVKWQCMHVYLFWWEEEEMGLGFQPCEWRHATHRSSFRPFVLSLLRPRLSPVSLPPPSLHIPRSPGMRKAERRTRNSSGCTRLAAWYGCLSREHCDVRK